LKETLNTDFGQGPDVILGDEGTRMVPSNETTNSNFHQAQTTSSINSQQVSNSYTNAGSKSPSPQIRNVVQENTPQGHVSMLNSV